MLTISIGYFLPVFIDRINDDLFGRVTILIKPELIEALNAVEEKGVLICLHGWAHEDFTALDAEDAIDRIDRGFRVFEEADLDPIAFLPPYIPFSMIPPSIKAAIESTGIPTRLPRVASNGTGISFGEYGLMWRNMTSFNDPRYQAERSRLWDEKPRTILLHVIEWNAFLKELITEYLRETDTFNTTVRIDDEEVNTPAWKIYEMAELLAYPSVGRVVYGVIPQGTWRGGDPQIAGIGVTSYMNAYWYFFLLTTFLPLAFFLFWRLASLRKKKPAKSDAATKPALLPSVSILIPAYNEERTIEKCIECALNQNYSGNKEIIVINDASTDETGRKVRKYPVNLISLKTNRGKAEALNMGMKKATGDILVFSDSDSWMAQDAVATLVETFQENPAVGAVAGNVFITEIDGKHSLLKQLQKIEYYTEQEVNRFLQSLNGNVLVCPGPLFAIRREFSKECIFNTKSIIEDAEFTIQIRRKSLKVVRTAKAKVHTDAPSSLRAWFNQRKRWWYGNLQLWALHKDWAKKDPWMILNYSGFIISSLSLLLLLLLPCFFAMYDNLALILIRGLAYAITPPLLAFALATPLFLPQKRLLVLLPLYVTMYSTLKVIMVTYLYLRYLSRRGVEVKFGPRLIKVK